MADATGTMNGTTEGAEAAGFASPWETVLSSVHTLWSDFLDHLPLLVAGLAVLALTWFVSWIVVGIVGRIVKRTKLGSSLRDLFTQLTNVVVWIVGILVAAIVVFPGMTPAKVLTVLGLSSVAIGFAFKDIFENFFAGVLILWRFPFDPGDYVECDGVAGRVVHTSIRMTTVRNVTGELVAVPNAMLFKNPVRVLTDRPVRRVTITCGVAYDADVDEAREVIRNAVESCETIAPNHSVEIFAEAFGSSSIDFEVTWWTGSKPVDVRRSRDEVVAAVKRALDEAGIEIPFPYRTLTFKDSLPLDGLPRELTTRGNDPALAETA